MEVIAEQEKESIKMKSSWLVADIRTEMIRGREKTLRVRLFSLVFFF
jgi:hypothetical protein